MAELPESPYRTADIAAGAALGQFQVFEAAGAARHRDGGAADHHPPTEGQRHRHAVPGAELDTSTGTCREWYHRHAGQRGELRNTESGLTARASWAIWRYTNKVTLL